MYNYLHAETCDFGNNLTPVLQGLNSQPYIGGSSATKLKG